MTVFPSFLVRNLRLQSLTTVPQSILKYSLFSPSFLTFLTEQFNPCSHFGLGSSNLSAHCQMLHGVWRSQQTKNGLRKLRLFTSFTTFILASLWRVSHCGWIAPFAFHIITAVSNSERSCSGQNNSQHLGLFLLQTQNFPFFVEIADAGIPCKHSISCVYDFCLMCDIYVKALLCLEAYKLRFVLPLKPVTCNLSINASGQCRKTTMCSAMYNS